MAKTPFIRPLQVQGGTFYTFTSSAEDLAFTFNNTTNQFRFSKFALLRIPEIGVPDSLATDNKFQFLAQGESTILEGLNPDQNINLAQSFQNYALNLESLLLSRPQYQRDEKLTVSERVFWKWLKESGAIRFRDANNLEKNIITLGSEKRFVEETSTLTLLLSLQFSSPFELGLWSATLRRLLALQEPASQPSTSPCSASAYPPLWTSHSSWTTQVWPLTGQLPIASGVSTLCPPPAPDQEAQEDGHQGPLRTSTLPCRLEGTSGCG
jgi:hypothetical protein